MTCSGESIDSGDLYIVQGGISCGIIFALFFFVFVFGLLVLLEVGLGLYASIGASFLQYSESPIATEVLKFAAKSEKPKTKERPRKRKHPQNPKAQLSRCSYNF